MAGLALPDLLHAEATSGTARRRGSHRSVIMIYLSGGPSHQDMYDLKMEIHGSFKPIRTIVTGLQICELMPGWRS